MHFIVLTSDQAETVAERYRVHDNSPARMAQQLEIIGDIAKLRLCRTIRRLERRFEIDLGAVCQKFLETERGPTPDVQRQVMAYVAWRELGGGRRDLVVSVDRVRQIGRLAEGDSEWASSHDS
ncbi:MAG: hypothetical protein P8Y29_08860 [Gemmatimonadota bacterium]